jgi:hypothetical protein
MRRSDMSPQRLTRLSITIFAVVVLGLLAVIFFQNDAEATRHCIEQGGTEASCGWR